MGGTVFFFFYGSIIFFIIAGVLRVIRTINAPVHVHWELYKESSVYELTDWWTKTHNAFGGKLWSMVLDILTLREFYLRNRRFWYPLIFFHAGLYLLILWHGWLFIRALVADGGTASTLGWVWGTLAALLTFVGGLAILWMRMTDGELKIHYPPIHYIKWVFILLTLLGGVYAVDIHFGSSIPALLKYVREQVTFANMEHKLHPAFGPAAHIAFASVWLIYLPFSHVFQLFFRYYHSLRWDDEPNARGSEIERRIKSCLERPVTWSAPHIPPGKTWGEVASNLQQNPGTGKR